MSIWKKSEDPWDWDPERRPAARDPETGGEEPGLLEELRDGLRGWSREWQEKKRRRETPPEPIPCPWCGKMMEPGYLVGGRDAVRLERRRPDALRMWDPEETVYIRGDGGFLCDYKIAWTCADCRKLVLDLPEPEPPLWDERSREEAENTREEEH